MPSRRAITGFAGLVVVALAGCATPGYSPSRIQSELMRAGVPQQQARCVTEALSDKYDESQLGSHSDPTPAEVDFTRLILKRCKVTVPLEPQP